MLSLFPQPGPSLRDFQTLLVKGAYHSSAPVHLLASHISQSENARGVLITPSRSKILKSLVEFNDDWIANNALLGHVAPIFSRVSVFYPPSPAHLSMLLSVLRTANMPEPPVALEINRETALVTAPSIVILHEPASYFTSRGIHDRNTWTVSSYLTLIARVFRWISVVEKAFDTPHRPIIFALFDSQLDNLKLPLVKMPSKRYDIGNEAYEAERNESVLLLAEKYFECIATFKEDIAEVPSSQDEELMTDHPNWRHLELFRRDRPDELETFRWLESEYQQGNKNTTKFVFDLS
ncbi:hypothetical protein BDQ17DRAFT_1537026 [Cyathus striatus]|nr:hypothetical protein BDQ17DRAFT_1537026 [Cyathus striatus]